jgi:hypothetical protein
LGRCSGEGAAHVSEQLALRHIRADRRAIDRNEGKRAPFGIESALNSCEQLSGLLGRDAPFVESWRCSTTPPPMASVAGSSARARANARPRAPARPASSPGSSRRLSSDAHFSVIGNWSPADARSFTLSTSCERQAL